MANKRKETMSVKKLTAQRLRQIVMEEAAAMRAPRNSVKLTESRLRQIIREELNQINESLPGRHAIWSAGAQPDEDAPYYEFYFTAKGQVALRDAAGDDREDKLIEFCLNHGCEQNDVAAALGGRRPGVLEDLKDAFPGAEFNGQKITDLKIS
jgi:hypothetical protein